MSEGRGWPHEPVDRGAPGPSVGVAEPVVLSVREQDSPPPPPPPPPTRTGAMVALAVVLTVASLLALFAVGDWWTRNRELDVLLTRIAVAEQAQQPMIQSFGRVARECALNSRCDVVAIQLAARSALPALQTTGDAVAATEIIRFHTALRDLRDRYVDHNHAWQAWLSSMASGTVGIEQPDDIGTTFHEAGRAAVRAIPPFPRHDAHARVQEIFFS
jgi:hypothetical protein